MKPLQDKLGLKSGHRLIIVNAPEPAPDLDLAKIDVRAQLRGEFDTIISFVTLARHLDAKFNSWKMHLVAEGRLWICWPKKGSLETDLNIKVVIRIGYEHGMVESNAIAVNDSWSALKFTHPKSGKAYNNSYGTLNAEAVRYYRK